MCSEWLSTKLEPLGIHTFADLKITEDDGTSLAPYQRYRLVTHTSDLTRGALVRLPWDLPYYLLEQPGPGRSGPADRGHRQLPGRGRGPRVDVDPVLLPALRQKTALGACTWVDGGLLQNFPVTVFDRTDGQPNRWPTFGIKLSARPALNIPDVPVHGDLRELVSIAHTRWASGTATRWPMRASAPGRCTWTR